MKSVNVGTCVRIAGLGPCIVEHYHVQQDTYTVMRDGIRRLVSGELLREEAFRSIPAPQPVKESVPILAHRAAIIDDALRLRPMYAFGFLDLRGTAECLELGFHEAPAWDCDCGFYAIPPDIPLYGEYTNRSYSFVVDLLVELSGRVIEHEHGYRAQHQSILEIRLLPCRRCDKPIEGVVGNQGYCSKHDPNRYPESTMPCHSWPFVATSPLSARAAAAGGCWDYTVADIVKAFPIPVTHAKGPS